ncbi:MAG: hypothetical protein ACLTZN_00965 [Streptococcus sp.]
MEVWALEAYGASKFFKKS